MSLLSKFPRLSWNKKSADAGLSSNQFSQALEAYLADFSSTTGVTVTKDTAMRATTVFACVRVLSESIGMLPIRLFRVGDNKLREVARDHQVNTLLSIRPNNFMTPQEFKELLVRSLCGSGNFYGYKTKVRGQVAEILPLHPGSVEPRLTDNWVPEYKVRFADGTTETLSQDEIWHVRLFTNNGLNGLSPIQYSREAIGLSLAAQEQGGRWFKDGVAPSGVLSTDQELSEGAFKRLRGEFEKNHASLSNFFKPMIFEMGLKWMQTSLNAEDMQYLETRKFQRDEICAIFRVPPHMVANLDKATFGNIEHQSLSFVTNSLVPYLTRIEERVQVGLLNEDDQQQYFAKFNANALLRGDIKSRFAAYKDGIQNGFMSPNEAREFEDWNPREGGDVFLTPMNMTTNPEENSDEKNA